jgi:hypothetical protein
MSFWTDLATSFDWPTRLAAASTVPEQLREALRGEVHRAITEGATFHAFKGRVEALFRKAGGVR